MKLVALTGGIASGKSSACRAFKAHGIRVTDADDVAADVLRDPAVLARLAQRFGDRVYDDSGDYNRPAMRQRVFSDPIARADLNAIVHPEIRRATQQKLALPHGQPYQIWAIPLLVETQQTHLPDQIVVLDVAQDVQIDRLIHRDGGDRESALKAINSQASREQRLAIAHHVIDNNGDTKQLIEQVNWIHHQLLEYAHESTTR